MYDYNLEETESWSDFWMTDTYIDDKQDLPSFNTDILKLISARKAITNFVTILTGENIPVNFITSTKSGMTDGKTIYLSSDILNKKEFDVAVGLALHEASHILLTDFELIKTMWGRISNLYKKGKEIGLEQSVVSDFTKFITNYVEDRYIDNFIFSNAPGYKPYYTALYEYYFNNEEMGEILQSKKFRTPNLESYEFRILGLTNPLSDLDSLSALKQIAEVLSLKNIGRLDTTKKRMNLAIQITEIIFDNIKNELNKPNEVGSNQSLISNLLTDNDQENGENVENKQDKENKQDSKKSEWITDDDLIGGSLVETDKITEPPKIKMKQNVDSDTTTKKIVSDYKRFFDHNVSKKVISDEQLTLVNIIEKSGISISTVGKSLKIPVECIVVKKLTKELMNTTMFPLSRHLNISNDNVINNGIQMGILLGNKLQVRRDINVSHYPRRSSGKIYKRHLHEIEWSESIFYKSVVDKYEPINLHISVDASGSMSEYNKWNETMAMVVAICKAASMVNNLRVVVSFRTTIQTGNNHLPYVVCAYDSNKDSFTKVKTLFKYLYPDGCTPEGLTFEAIMDELICKKTNELWYFLNISDGQPYLTYKIKNSTQKIEYSECGVAHTRQQYKKIIESGVKGMSYFIKSGNDVYNKHSAESFKKMYGDDARFIDVNNVRSIANTINDLFLKKE